MSLLAGITKGKSKSGIRMVICGQEKVGKTTLACGSPNSLLIPLEVGFGDVETDKVPIIQSYAQMLQLLNEIVYYAQNGQFPYKSLIFDSITAIERLQHSFVIHQDPASKLGTNKSCTMESAHGGYGKAYNMANDYFKELLEIFDNLAVHAGINIIITAHVFSSRITDPTVGEYDSWDLLLHSPKNEKTYGKRELLAQWADVIGFLYEPLMLIEGENSNRGISQNKGRVLAVSRTPSYVAGNRFRMQGEIAIKAPPNNCWNDFAEELFKSSGIDVRTV